MLNFQILEKLYFLLKCQDGTQRDLKKVALNTGSGSATSQEMLDATVSWRKQERDSLELLEPAWPCDTLILTQ